MCDLKVRVHQSTDSPLVHICAVSKCNVMTDNKYLQTILPVIKRKKKKLHTLIKSSGNIKS